MSQTAPIETDYEGDWLWGASFDRMRPRLSNDNPPGNDRVYGMSEILYPRFAF